MPTVFLAPAAERDIRKLDRSVQEELRKSFAQLAENPVLGKQLHGKLKGISLTILERQVAIFVLRMR